MLKDSDLVHEYDPNNLGLALCWVIDQDVVYDMALNYEMGKFFLNAKDFSDVSGLYQENDGITIRITNLDNTYTDFNTSEYFGSVLLSNPIIVNLDNHKNGAYVVSFNAKFINYEFIIPQSSNPQSLDPWHPHQAPINGELTNCYSDCNCGWIKND